MSDPSEADRLVDNWLQPLADDGAPCGPDLEYDNDFLGLAQAAAGKPETQFGAAEPPNWREVVSGSEELFDRTRDLRVAVYWLRGMLHLHGYAMLVPGLRLITGLLRDHAEHVHPLPDPDDGDPYARVNTLTLLREVEGLIGDLRSTRIVADRAIGEITGRAVEVVAGLSPLREGESDPGRAVLQQMIAAAAAKQPDLRATCEAAVEGVRELAAAQKDLLGDDAPDLRPLRLIVEAVAALLPEEVADDEAAADGEAGDEEAGGGGGGGGSAAPRRGLSGTVTSREEAIRAIDMVCAYLESAEPTNPAPLYLRRGRQLISHNFLQLMKVLAPDALSEVARVVGIDPDSVETPDGS
jgi:type VI secretion system protein ImpA